MMSSIKNKVLDSAKRLTILLIQLYIARFYLNVVGLKPFLSPACNVVSQGDTNNNNEIEMIEVFFFK